MYAVDNEEDMIKATNINLKNYILEGRVKLIYKDGLEYVKGLEKNSIDVFVSGLTIHNFEQDYRKEFLKYLYGVLKPNGLFINADKYSQDEEKEHMKHLNQQLNKIFETFTPINRFDLIQKWGLHYFEDNQPNVLMKEQESIKQMKEIGYRDVKKVYRKHQEAIITAKK